MTGTGDIAAAAAREIVARHEFFVDWFAGRLEDSAFAAALAAFDPDFHRIGPDGALQDHNGLTAMLSAANAPSSQLFAPMAGLALTFVMRSTPPQCGHTGASPQVMRSRWAKAASSLCDSGWESVDNSVS
mgnify:CR=1 FL=1